MKEGSQSIAGVLKTLTIADCGGRSQEVVDSSNSTAGDWNLVKNPPPPLAEADAELVQLELEYIWPIIADS
jgi:hypothetical protein